MENNLIINLSGLGYSGSTALRDALLEYSEISYFNPLAKGYPEYNLVSDPGGFLDIHRLLEENWNYLSSINVLRSNRALFCDITPKRSLRYPYGLYLDKYSNGKAEDLYNKFLKEISINEFFLDSRINYLTRDGVSRIIEKVLRKLYLSSPKSDFLLNPSRSVFLKSVKKFHENIFFRFETKKVLVEKAIPVYNIVEGHSFFSNIKSIVVFRNPADVLAEMFLRKTAIFKGVEKLSPEKINDFLDWQNIYFKRILELSKSDDVLVLPFEMLIEKPEAVLGRVERFLDLKIRPKDFHRFSPKKSKQNINKYLAIFNTLEQEQILKSSTYKLYMKLVADVESYI